MKKIIAVFLAVVLIAGGLGGLVYASNNSLEPMTGQKLVGQGICGRQPLPDPETYETFNTMFIFTNPDCVSEITIDRISIFDYDGTVIYDSARDGWIEDEVTWTKPMKSHELRGIELSEYLPSSEEEEFYTFCTVEVFWTKSHKEGLPLTGWASTGIVRRNTEGGILGFESMAETQMVNMEQVLKPEKPKKVYNIGITQIVTHPDLDAVRHGFIKQMAEEGFVEGVNVEYDFRNPEEDLTEAARIAEEFVGEKVDLILSITTPSSQACVEAARGTDIPVVFAAVTAPVESGIVSTWDAPRPDNVTGVSDFPDTKAQMELIKEILPEATVLGVIYNPDNLAPVMQIDQLKDIMADVGIEDIVEATVATPEDVYEAAMSLVGRCDAIWIPEDGTVSSALESVVVVAEANQIPLFGSMQEMVEGGCIATYDVDYTWEGEEAGRYAARILKGEFAGDIPVGRCSGENLLLVVNPAAALRMGVTIPQSVLDRADRIVGE